MFSLFSSWMYNFQRQLTRKLKQTDQESGKDTNGNISTMDAIALASEAKGHINGIVSNALHEHICDHNCAADNCVRTSNTGVDNKTFIPDIIDNGELKTEHNTHL